MMTTPMTTHDGQSMIVKGSLVDKPSEPKSRFVLSTGISHILLAFSQFFLLNENLQNVKPIINFQKEQRNEAGDGLNKIEEWDNKMAEDMLPLDKEAEAFGDKPPEASYDKEQCETSKEQENKENVETPSSS